MSRALYQFADFSINHGDTGGLALDKIDASIHPGDFLLVIGACGSGKSSLLASLAGLAPRFTGGKVSGELFFKTRKLESMKSRESAAHIGYVSENPHTQLLYNSVEHELAFPLRAQGWTAKQVRARVREVCRFFDLERLLSVSSLQLSDGEKQKVAIAASLAAGAEVLILDEPSRHLSPFAAERLYGLLSSLNDNFGLTIIVSEHNLQLALAKSSTVWVLDSGKLSYSGSKTDFLSEGIKQHHEQLGPLHRLSLLLKTETVATTVRDFQDQVIKTSNLAALAEFAFSTSPVCSRKVRETLDAITQNQKISSSDLVDMAEAEMAYRAKEKPGPLSRFLGLFSRAQAAKSLAEPVPSATVLRRTGYLEARDLRFSYQQTHTQHQALAGISFIIPQATICSLIGENGSGKSTLILALAGLLDDLQGQLLIGEDSFLEKKASLQNLVTYIPSDPLLSFITTSVVEELRLGATEKDLSVSSVLDLLDIIHLEKKEPRNLSLGERKLLALGIALLRNTPYILADELTSGLDQKSLKVIGEILLGLSAQGKIIVLSSHDLDFVEQYSHYSMLVDNGELLYYGPTQEVLSQTFYLRTMVSRARKGISLPVKDAFGSSWLEKRAVAYD